MHEKLVAFSFCDIIIFKTVEK